VEIGFIDFQGRWEGRENSFIVFPSFPSTGISTVCFGLRIGHAAANKCAFSNSAGLR
jgi:hypothetical protein